MSRKRNFYSEFNATKEEIDEIINSKLDIADSEVIISAWKGYLNGPCPKLNIINSPEYKNACDKISKLLEEKKNNSKQKESSAFYDMFNGYSPYDIDKAFEKLTDKQKNIILKKWNGDIKVSLSKGVDMIIDEFNGIIREMFNISDSNKTEDNSYKLR